MKDRSKLTKTDVQGQMNAIRANVKGKLEENIKEGKKQKNNRAGGEEPGKPPEGTAGKVGESPPEEFLNFEPTDMEERLAEWTKGGDDSFFRDYDAGTARRSITFEEGEEIPPEARERAAVIREVDKSELADEFTGQLGVYLRNQLVKHKETHPSHELEEKHVKLYLIEARDKGPPEVSAEADRILGSRAWDKVGYNPDSAFLSTFKWDSGVGRAKLRYKNVEWDVVDYGDKLPISEKLEHIVGPAPSQTNPQEIRQCLMLHCTAGLMTTHKGRYPTLQELHSEAQKHREEAAEQAAQALDHLGEMPEEMGRAEADVRVFVHDFLHYSHDKDYRCLAAFVPVSFEAVRFHVVRMDPQGELTVEDICGPCHRAGKDPEVWLLVHNGHMRLLGKPATAEQAGRCIWRQAKDLRRVFAPGTFEHVLGVNPVQKSYAVPVNLCRGQQPQSWGCTPFQLDGTRHGHHHLRLLKPQSTRRTSRSRMRNSRNGLAPNQFTLRRPRSEGCTSSRCTLGQPVLYRGSQRVGWSGTLSWIGPWAGLY